MAPAVADEYYASGPAEAVYIAWTEDSGGHLQGQVNVVVLPSPNSTTLKTTNAAFSGTRNGGDVSLTFGALSSFGGITWTGHTGWRRLALVIPTIGVPQKLTFQAGSFDDFESAVAKMRAEVRKNQMRQQLLNSVSDAARQLRNGSDSIDRGLAELDALFATTAAGGSLKDRYARQWVEMQGAWRKEQDTAAVTPMTCYQKAQVSYEATQVSYQLTQFVYLDTQVNHARDEYDRARSAVQDGIQEIEAWAPIFNSRARAYDAAVGQSFNRDAVAAFRPNEAHDREMLATYAERLSRFTSYVVEFDQRAKAQNEQAKAFAESVSCN